MNTIYHLYVELKKYTKLVNWKKKLTHRYREQTSDYQWGDGTGKGGKRAGKYKIQTLMYKISYKDVLYNTRNTTHIL